ncbi:MAG: DUF6444 domain-containing protein [Thiolinea sp.]
MTFPSRPSRPLTLKAALKQLDESWEIIESFRSLHQEHEQLKQDFIELSQRLDEVVSQLHSSSRNSSKPPSSDTPEQKAKRPRSVSGVRGKRRTTRSSPARAGVIAGTGR